MPLKTFVFIIEGEDYVAKKVVRHSNPTSSHIYLPISWAGDDVVVIRKGQIVSMIYKKIDE